MHRTLLLLAAAFRLAAGEFPVPYNTEPDISDL